MINKKTALPLRRHAQSRASPDAAFELEFDNDYLKFMMLKHDRLLWPWPPHAEHTAFFLTEDFSKSRSNPLPVSEKLLSADVSYTVGRKSDGALAVHKQTSQDSACNCL
jgi:hypothetical protein